MTPVLVAIDPGYAKRGQGCAVAIFVDGRLACVRFERPETVALPELAVGARDVVWECPQIDARTRSATPQVLTLAATGGTLAGLYAGCNACRAVPVSPAEWKQSTPKPVHHARIWARLHDDERDLLGGEKTKERIDAAKRKGALERWAKSGALYYPPIWLTHNLLDAVGLGLWRLGR